jgi:Flp pilus assembly protein TadG
MKHLLRFFSTIIAATYLSGAAAVQYGFAASLLILLSGIIVAVWSLHWK